VYDKTARQSICDEILAAIKRGIEDKGFVFHCGEADLRRRTCRSSENVGKKEQGAAIQVGEEQVGKRGRNSLPFSSDRARFTRKREEPPAPARETD